MVGVENIIITKDKYEFLVKRDMKLNALESCGVDNWKGYDDSIDMYYELLKENNLEK
jgi:hypothetical protein